MNGTIDSKTISFKHSGRLIGIVLGSIFIGRIGTAYLVGKDLVLILFFTFVVVVLVSFPLSFAIVSPNLKEIPLKKFLRIVLPLFLVLVLVLGFVVNLLFSLI